MPIRTLWKFNTPHFCLWNNFTSKREIDFFFATLYVEIRHRWNALPTHIIEKSSPLNSLSKSPFDVSKSTLDLETFAWMTSKIYEKAEDFYELRKSSFPRNTIYSSNLKHFEKYFAGRGVFFVDSTVGLVESIEGMRAWSNKNQKRKPMAIAKKSFSIKATTLIIHVGAAAWIHFPW